METYGETMFGPDGLRGAMEKAAPALKAMLRHAPGYGLEAATARLMAQVEPLLPGTAPNVYLGTLLFMAPAATLGVLGRPAVALGLERFHPGPPPHQPKYWYHPAEVVEMLPHEAAHVARMQVLKLPPTPRRLTLLDMAMLEGTALTFTDLLLGRQTLATFLPADRLAWHRANDAYIRQAVLPDLAKSGMETFLRYFGADSPISGYYVGYSYCCDWLNRHGFDRVRDLVALPSHEILRTLR
ncbi:MAG TPA: DUF2268 domain-containing putative Zn-dependent protease [Symbiobacteriaceae bacterium]|nr:DUF2268 domain-containing putative Zn-dependent protease [Symbiobacteriaceae bacterium]